jgi:hypothetical protein
MKTIALRVPIPEQPKNLTDVHCPYCGANPGEECVVRTTMREDRSPHQRRVDRWAGQIEMHVAFTTYMKNGAPFTGHDDDPGWNDPEAMTMTLTPGTD